MAAQGGPRALILAGVILTLVGLIIVLTRTFEIPRYWVPLLVGIGLLVAGGLWFLSCRGSRPS